MVEFGYLPDQIQQLANRQLTSRPIRFCALGGSQVFQPDFVVLTDSQLLVLTEQNMLSLYPFALLGLMLISWKSDASRLNKLYGKRLFDNLS